LFRARLLAGILFGMAIDTPAKLAVLGAGPVGLEAALYARFLGYDVEIYERGRVAEHVQRWGHATMFTPFGMNRSPLGLAALAAHDAGYVPPPDDEMLTGRAWAERYLIPLSQTDLLADHVRLGCEVLAVGKDEILKTDLPVVDAAGVGSSYLQADEERGDYDFRLLIRDAAGREEIRKADAVLDATGVYGNPNWLGQGGIPAAGETVLREQIEYGLPDVLGVGRAKYAGRHTLVFGSGLSAASTVVSLAQLAATTQKTHVTWLTRRERLASRGPVPILPDDLFPARERMLRAANELALTNGPFVTWRPATFIDGVRREVSGEFVVTLSGKTEGQERFDQIVANVGYRPDKTIYSELQIGAGEMGGALSEVASEPNFYILGAKSRGRRSDFLFRDGLEQIRRVFAIIGDRADLDLYAGAKRLVLEP
jgi:thioredoxin reductase